MGQQDRGQIKESQSKPSCTFILWVVMGKHHCIMRLSEAKVMTQQ